jgi:uncharacterized paraquat-inducible protein A
MPPRSHKSQDDWDDDFEDDFDDESDEETMPCPYCGESMHEEAVQCPHCGNYLSEEDMPSERKPIWLVVTVLICLMIALGWALSGW